MTNWEARAGGSEADKRGIPDTEWQGAGGRAGKRRGRGSLKFGSTREEGRKCKKRKKENCCKQCIVKLSHVSKCLKKMRIPVFYASLNAAL